MAKSRSLQQAVRFALAAVSAAAGVSTVSGQEAPPAPPAQAEAQANAAPLQEVVVTGSRLMNPKLDLDQPDHDGFGDRYPGDGPDACRRHSQQPADGVRG